MVAESLRAEKTERMDIHHLVKMANEIGGFFETLPDRNEAVNSIEQHLKNFWEPRMRREIIEYAKRGDGELTEIVREAVLRLEHVQKPA